MANSKEFSRAWFEWQRMDAPVSNFRHQRTTSPTYRIEHDLDHLASYVHGLGLKAMSNEPVDFAKLASQELVELQIISTELENSSISPMDRQVFEAYVLATRRLLDELKSVVLD